MITFGLAQILGSLNWRELSAKLTEGVPARRRQRAQYIIAVRSSRHNPSTSLPPSSGRREERKPTCDDVVGGHRCTENNCRSAKTYPLRRDHGSGALHGKHQPLKRPKVLTEGLSKKESNKTPTAIPNPPPRKERSEWSKNKVLCPSFFQERGPPEAPRLP